MIEADPYIGQKIDVDTEYNHVALEAALRAVENDSEVPPYVGNHHIDLRSKAAVASIQALRDLIRMPGFEIDLNKRLGAREDLHTYSTPYGRTVKKGWQTNHYMVQTEKGWLIFDYGVDAHVTVVK